MGYRIAYEDSNVIKTPLRRKRKTWRLLAVALALVIGLSIPQVRRTLRDIVLPGKEEITAKALGDLVTDLRRGEPFGEAVEAFCLEIIHGG